MSIRFAASRSACATRMLPQRVRAIRQIPANDNLADGLSPDQMSAALRHFAQHGLAAAQHAQEKAILAARTGQRKDFDHWLGICRALDRRLANSMSRASDGLG